MKISKKDFIWNFVGITINSFNSLFFLIVANLFNTKTDAGIFSFAFSFICMMYIIGIYFGRTFQIANSNIYSYNTFLKSRLISCVLMFFLTILFLIINNYSFFKFIIIVEICIYRVFEAYSDCYYGILQNENLLYKVGISQTLKSILSLGLFVLIDIFTNNLIYSLFGVIFSFLVVMIFYDYKNVKKHLKKEKVNIFDVIQLLKNGFPVFLFSILSIYTINVTKYFIDFYYDPLIVNIFGILIMPATFISLFSQYIFTPYINSIKLIVKNNESKQLFNILKKIICFIFFLGILCIIGSIFIGSELLGFIYNIDLLKYRLDLIIILLGAVLYSLVSVLSSILIIYDKNFIQTIFYIIASIFGTLASIIWISKFQIRGGAIIYALIMLTLFLMYLIETIKTIKGGYNEK